MRSKELKFLEQDYITVKAEIKVERTCGNCLYCGCNGLTCGNANNQGKIMLLVNGGRACQYFWLNQNKYPNAESNW